MPWPPRPDDALPAEHMITTRVRMERDLYERACEVAASRGQTYAEFITDRLKAAVAWEDWQDKDSGRAEARAA